MVANKRMNALDSLGVKLDAKMTVKDALCEAGAGFGVRKLPLQAVLGSNFSAPGDKSHVIVTDKDAVLGMVGRDYNPVSHVDFMLPIAEKLVETGATIDNVTTRDCGAHCYMRITQGKNFKIGGKVGDLVGAKLTLSSSLDGDFANKLSASILRLACENGMTMPVGVSEFTIAHDVSLWKLMARIDAELPKLQTYFRQFTGVSEILAQTKLSAQDKRTRDIVAKIVDPKRKAGKLKGGDDNAAERRIQHVLHLFGGNQPGANNVMVRDTAYGLWQAVGDIENHGQDDVEARFNRMLPVGGNSGVRNINRSFDVIVDSLGLRDKVNQAVAALAN